MRRMILALAGALFAVALPAQADADKAQGGLAELTAEWKAANADYRAAMQKVQSSDEYKTARSNKDYDTLRGLMADLKRPDAKAFGARALELADAREGDEALVVLTFIANNLYDADTFKGLIARVERDHLTSAKLGGILANGNTLAHFAGPEQTAALLQRIAKENEANEPRAWAMYWESTMITRNKESDDDDKARAERLLEDAEALAAGTALGDRIAAPRFEKEKLQIGMAAPDILGTDTDGVDFKLSDYRGKVVVLDFWGFW